MFDAELSFYVDRKLLNLKKSPPPRDVAPFSEGSFIWGQSVPGPHILGEGGKTAILGSDFRQIPPAVPNAGRSDVLNDPVKSPRGFISESTH